jgi:small subunit ribosomal protein S4
MLSPNAKLEEVLDLNVEDVLRRRLQSLVHKRGLSSTANEARQFVVHGHITLNGKKINAPGHIVDKADEENIGFYPGSPVAKEVSSEEKTEESVEEVEE